MSPSLTALESLLREVVLATLAVGLPILLVLAIRFLLDRHVNLGRSKELEKLIWQLHRIASALEHQMNLSFPAVQPGTEEPQDLAYLQRQVAATAAPKVAPAHTAAATGARPSSAPQPAAEKTVEQQPSSTVPAAEQPALPVLERRDPSVQAPRAGVNSMFDL